MPFATRSGPTMLKNPGKGEWSHPVPDAGQALCDPNNGVTMEERDAGSNDADPPLGKMAEAANSAEFPSAMVNLNALSSTLEAVSQALGDQASRVTAIEEKLGKLCIPPDARPCHVTDVSEKSHELSTAPPHDLRTDAAASQRDTATATQPTRCDVVGRRFAKPQDFDGSSPWRSFISQFESIANGHGWTASDRLSELVACLRGPALEVFAHLPDTDRLDYHSLTVSLESRFGVMKQEPWFRSQLRRRTRGTGETLPSLARDVERLVAMAYPSAVQELRDSLACDQFLDALNDADLQIAVRQGRPSSLQDALANAIEIEAIRRSAQPSGTGTSCTSVFVRGSRASEDDLPESQRLSKVQSIPDALQQILHSLNELKKDLNRAPTTRGRGRGLRRETWGSRTPGVCWSCGDKGHIRRNCPRASHFGADESSPKPSEN